jgi:uncharacterized protein (DUF433 family)
MPNLPLDPEPHPIRIDEGGTVRVGQTRVNLEIVIYAYQDGRSPEDIVESYPTLALADVYASIAYYLRHREAVERYMREEEAAAAEIRKKLEAMPENAAFRARAQARMAQRQRA